MPNPEDAILSAHLFDVSPAPAVITRLRDNTILAINQYTSELFDIAQDEARGQSVLEFYVDAAARQRLAEIVKRDFRADEVRLHVKRRNGETLWVHANARLISVAGEPAVMTVFRDITDQLAAEQALKASEKRLEAQSAVLTELTDRHTDRRGGFQEELRDILAAVAQTLGVARVGMWRVNADRSEIRCVSMYVRATKTFESGAVLLREAAPDYFRALERDRVIAAENALIDHRTCEFKETYLVPNQIGAMLDIPLRQDDAMTGVLCAEHVGGPREWTIDEQNFAHSSANLIATAAADEDLRDTAVALAHNRSLMQHLLDSAPAAFVAVDAAGQIVTWNAHAEATFGWSRNEVVGRSLADTLIPPARREAYIDAVRRFLDALDVPVASKRLPLTAQDRHGRELPMEMAITATRLGNSVYCGAFFVDAPKAP
jgi:PAS domain S-box-containing protein